MHQLVLRTTLPFALAFASSANALDFDFTGRAPDLSGNFKVHAAAGVLPGIPVLFDLSQPEKVILRPAHDDEKSNESRPVYRFEWQADKTAMFYELYDPKLTDQLTQRNAKDSVSPDGKTYEIKVVQSFFAEGQVLKTCVPPDFIGGITAYIVISESGNQEQVVVLPEGGITQCILKETKARTYPVPLSPFVAKASIRITE